MPERAPFRAKTKREQWFDLALAEHGQGTTREWVLARSGDSWDRLGRALSPIVDRHVSGETLRSWFADDPEIAAARDTAARS